MGIWGKVRVGDSYVSSLLSGFMVSGWEGCVFMLCCDVQQYIYIYLI